MKKNLITRMLALAMAAVLAVAVIPAAAADKTFPDVPSGHWAAKEIQYAVDHGIVSGYTDGTFGPADSVTTAQFAAFLARAFYYGEIDQSATPWYAPYVNIMKAHGLFDSTEVGKDLDASVNQPINRYNMAQMMYNVLQDKGMDISVGIFTTMTEEHPRGLNWIDLPVEYRTAVAACYSLDILKGQSDGAFGGRNLMDRAQACVVIYRLINKLGGMSAGVQPGETVTPVTNHVLTNGKPVTEDNVLEVIEQIKKDYPDGTVYQPVTGGLVALPDGSYEWHSDFGAGYRSDAIYGYIRSEDGCNGWAALCSDLIFGQYSNNKSHEQKDHSKIRPGDIIEYRDITTNKTAHYEIVVTKNDYVNANGYNEDGSRYPISTFDTSGSSAGANVVNWPFSTSSVSVFNYEPYAKNDNLYWVVWTRYPD